jgi:hypothetical protein
MWFLLIPPVAVLVSLLWLALAKRPDRAPGAITSVERYRRSMDALARPMDAEHDRHPRTPFPRRR